MVFGRVFPFSFLFPFFFFSFFFLSFSSFFFLLSYLYFLLFEWLVGVLFVLMFGMGFQGCSCLDFPCLESILFNFFFLFLQPFNSMYFILLFI